MVAQMASKPLADDAEVSTELVIGPEARKPLTLSMHLFVSAMSFGALSEEAKIALARGAELAGIGLCSGAGGMLPAAQQATPPHCYELLPATFRFKQAPLHTVPPFPFNVRHSAKNATHRHLPANNHHS